MVGPICMLSVLIVSLLIVCSSSQLSKNKTELLNWCLKSKNHKTKPGKEDSLHSQCTPWKDHACCTEEVTLAIHSTDIYNFTLDHCFQQIDRNMSEGCRKYFIKDNCFYECEPSIGLWVVEVNRTIAKERYYKVPLCASDCDSWFEACKDDYTCVQNWPREFKFSKGRNFCPENSKCQTFKDVYHTSQEFCEKVWDDSWEYTPSPKPCMQMWFDGSNPNADVAELYYEERFGGGAAAAASTGLVWLALLILGLA